MKQNKTLAIALAALFTSSLALADSEVSGKLVLEQAGLTDGGALKNEMKYKLYADGDITDNMTYHAELQGSSDSDKVGGYSGEYTQNANLREMYVDINGGAFDARIGKQQVVWGTADGMKLLDMINPTDYAEMAQDQMEDSRIPVWAVNLERDNMQMIISQPKENVFAGLNRGTDTAVRTNAMDGSDIAGVGTDAGNAFLMMGPDSITGAENGFLNIAPDLGSIAGGFGGAFMPLGSAANQLGGLGNPGMSDLLSAFTVGAFTSGATLQQLSDQFGNMQMGKAFANGTYTGAADLATFLSTYDHDNDGTPSGAMVFRDLNFAGAVAQMGCAGGPDSLGVGSCAADGSTTQADFDILAPGMTGTQILNGWSAGYGSNLSSFGDGSTDSAFEYMTNTGFRTFDTFVNARSQYVYNMPKGSNADIALRTQHSTKGGTNYSLNFSNSYDKNPVIDLSWRNDAGEVLTQTVVDAPLTMAGAPVVEGTYLELTDGAGTVYGGATGNSAILTFEQGVRKVKNIGGSFDSSFESPVLGPVVVRGEVLYTQGGAQPVMNLDKLSQGDLVGALSMQDANRLKYVLGLDVTVLTNMLISGQYITDRNLDHKDNGGEYTTDYATMHLSNGFNKAIEDKQFYSLFFSKPFGESGQHRWNNIYMFEEGNGNWNRLDVSWGLSDDVEGTFELNNYWGEHNTQFGQLKGSSNIQTGLNFSF